MPRIRDPKAECIAGSGTLYRRGGRDQSIANSRSSRRVIGGVTRHGRDAGAVGSIARALPELISVAPQVPELA